MPLKHATETALIFILGAVLLLTGIVAALLPGAAQQPVWWGIAIAAAAAYPLALYPLFKSRRADYPFRALHFAPLAILLIRLALDLGAGVFPVLTAVTAVFLWAWTAPALILVFLLLGIFCWQVLRQRDQRIRYLLATLIPFVIFGAVSRTSPAVPVNPPIVAVGGSSASTASASSAQLGEIAWQMQMRRRDRRSARIEAWQDRLASGDIAAFLRGAKDGVASVLAMLSSGATSSAATSGASSVSSAGVIAAASSSASSARIVAVQPPSLTKTGGEWSLLGVPMLAGYCAVLHRRATRRVRA